MKIRAWLDRNGGFKLKDENNNVVADGIEEAKRIYPDYDWDTSVQYGLALLGKAEYPNEENYLI